MHRFLRQMDLNLLVVFDALMEERNVSRAAAHCSLSQPAMSSALNRLRQMLEDPILIRTASGMRPSPRAVALEGPIRSFLNQVERELRPRPDFHPATSDRQFRIALTDYGENVVLPKLSQRLWEGAPQVRLDVSRLTPVLPERALEKGELDLVIAVQEYGPVPNRLRSRTWIKEQLVCLSRKSKTQKKDISLKEFTQRRHIYPSPLGVKTNIVDEWLAQQGLSRDIAVSTHSYLVAARLTAETDFILSLPNRMARQFTALFPLDILKPPKGFPGFRLNLVWHPLYENDPGLKWMMSQMKEVEQSITQP